MALLISFKGSQPRSSIPRNEKKRPRTRSRQLSWRTRWLPPSKSRERRRRKPRYVIFINSDLFLVLFLQAESATALPFTAPLDIRPPQAPPLQNLRSTPLPFVDHAAMDDRARYCGPEASIATEIGDDEIEDDEDIDGQVEGESTDTDGADQEGLEDTDDEFNQMTRPFQDASFPVYSSEPEPADHPMMPTYSPIQEPPPGSQHRPVYSFLEPPPISQPRSVYSFLGPPPGSQPRPFYSFPEPPPGSQPRPVYSSQPASQGVDPRQRFEISDDEDDRISMNIVRGPAPPSYQSSFTDSNIDPILRAQPSTQPKQKNSRKKGKKGTQSPFLLPFYLIFNGSDFQLFLVVLRELR